MAGYQHVLDEKITDLPLGKIVCVGRNYAAHIRELKNLTPSEPILFIKPATALVALEEPFSIPSNLGSCHFETELAILIKSPLSQATESGALQAIAGIGLALDLTLRDLQNKLKQDSLPWEKSKAFDGACPTSKFVSFSGDLQNLQIKLSKNDLLQQNGNSKEMITPTLKLLSYASNFFTLMPGDILLTGTPQGVGKLTSGDELKIELENYIKILTSVI